MTNMDRSRSKYQLPSPLCVGIQRKMRPAVRLGAVIGLSLGWSMASALNTGTDTDLSLAPAAGGMGGAAFTKPIEPAGAVFGNPATLTQFQGTQFQIAASFLVPKVDVTQSGAAIQHGHGARNCHRHGESRQCPKRIPGHGNGAGHAGGHKSSPGGNPRRRADAAAQSAIENGVD